MWSIKDIITGGFYDEVKGEVHRSDIPVKEYPTLSKVQSRIGELKESNSSLRLRPYLRVSGVFSIQSVNKEELWAAWIPNEGFRMSNTPILGYSDLKYATESVKTLRDKMSDSAFYLRLIPASECPRVIGADGSYVKPDIWSIKVAGEASYVYLNGEGEPCSSPYPVVHYTSYQLAVRARSRYPKLSLEVVPVL